MVGFVFGIIVFIIAVIAFILARSFGKRRAAASEGSQEEGDWSVGRGIARVVGVIALLGSALLLIFSFFFTQDVGQSSVLVDITGNVQGSVDGSGLHGKAPWVNAVTFNTRNQRVVFVNPKTSTGDNAGGEADGREIAVIDKDGVDSNVDVTIRYNLDPTKVTDIYRQYKDEPTLEATLINNDIRSVVRSEAGKYHTLDLLTKRATLQADIREVLDARWRSQGVLIDEVALQQIDPPASVKEAYANAQKSQIEVQKAQNDLNATKVSAQQKVVQAQATADANKLLTLSLTPQILENKYLDALKNGTVYVVPAGSTPFITTK